MPALEEHELFVPGLFDVAPPLLDVVGVPPVRVGDVPTRLLFLPMGALLRAPPILLSHRARDSSFARPRPLELHLLLALPFPPLLAPESPLPTVASLPVEEEVTGHVALPLPVGLRVHTLDGWPVALFLLPWPPLAVTPEEVGPLEEGFLVVGFPLQLLP